MGYWVELLLLAGDRLGRLRGLGTVAGRLGTCHAERFTAWAFVIRAGLLSGHLKS
jgi:hypothetical protein